MILFCVSLCLLSSLGFGQANGKVNFGGTLPTQTAWAARFLQVDSAVKLLKYATPDTNKVLGFDANGNAVLRTKVPAGAGTGTVTNVSTGWGMLGGPITTVGTVLSDSNYVTSILRTYKITDSVASLIPDVSGYVPLDTLPYYFSKPDSNTLGNAITLTYFNDNVPDVTNFVRDSRTLRINGVGYDLSADRTWNVGTLVGSDTVAISNRINEKQSFTDTAAWDATKANLNTGLAGKQNFSDTSTWDATRTWVNSRVQTVTTTNFTTSYTINSANAYKIQITITAQAGALLFNNPTGTWANNQPCLVNVTDNGTNRAITFDTKFAGANGASLPTTTTTGRPLSFIIRYDSNADKYYVSLF